MSGLHTKRNPVTATKTRRVAATGLHIAREAIAAGGGGGGAALGNVVAVAGLGDPVDILSGADGSAVETHTGYADRAMATGNDGSYYTDESGTLVKYDAEGNQVWSVVPFGGSNVRWIVCPQNSSVMAVGTGSDAPKILDPSDGSTLWTAPIAQGYIDHPICPSPDGSYFFMVAGGFKGTGYIYDTSDNSRVSVGTIDIGCGAYFADDASVVAVGSADKDLRLFNVADGSLAWEATNIGSGTNSRVMAPVIEQEAGFVWALGLIGSDGNTSIYKVDLSDGTLLEEFSTGLASSENGEMYTRAMRKSGDDIYWHQPLLSGHMSAADGTVHWTTAAYDRGFDVLRS